MDRILNGLFPVPRTCRLLHGRCELDRADVERSLNHRLGPEAYRLFITRDSVVLEASTEGGFFLASQTMKQIRLLSGKTCPCLEIEDEPDLGVRGYMLDISRCKVPTMDHLFRLVDLLALFKYNQLQLYTEHTFAYAGHERVWEAASPMTAEQVRELSAYCAERHIELVPNQNAFGHMERWLRHPEYQHLAECPDGYMHPISGWKAFGSVLYPDGESIAFVGELLEQLLPCFNSGWVHLGCDEPWELGQGKSEDRVATEGRHGLFRDHVRRLHALASQHGKHMLFWSDELRSDPVRIREFPADIIPVVWGYEADHPFEPECQVYADEHVVYLIAPGDSSWNSFTGRLETATVNILRAAQVALDNEAMGLLLTSWGDMGHQQTWPTQLPALLLFGAAAWNRRSLDPNPAVVHCTLAEAMDRFVFKDKSSAMGNFWCELARIDALVPVKLNPANSSFPYDALYAPKNRLRHALRPLEEEDFFPALTHLESLTRQLTRTDCLCDDAVWILDEARLAIEMTRFGLKRAEAVLKGHDPRDAMAGWEQTVLAFEEIWLRRNREGGLPESRQRLASLAPL